MIVVFTKNKGHCFDCNKLLVVQYSGKDEERPDICEECYKDRIMEYLRTKQRLDNMINAVKVLTQQDE